jgi:peroxiredoxin Q/BCP
MIKGKNWFCISIRKRFTTCTLESCNLRDNYGSLKKNGFEVIGVSPDNEKTQKKFEIKFKLPFPLIADPENKITALYGVHDMKKLFGREYMGILRTTFIIDEKGVSKNIHKPKNKAHAQKILAAMKPA